MLGLPDEKSEQESPEHDNADGDGEQAGAGRERKPRNLINRPHAEQEAEQEKRNPAGDDGVCKRGFEPLAKPGGTSAASPFQADSIFPEILVQIGDRTLCNPRFIRVPKLIDFIAHPTSDVERPKRLGD